MSYLGIRPWCAGGSRNGNEKIGKSDISEEDLPGPAICHVGLFFLLTFLCALCSNRT